MTNEVFAKTKTALGEGKIKWQTDRIRCALVDNGVQVPDIANDEFLADIDKDAVVALSEPLRNKTCGEVCAGAFDADDVTFEEVDADQVGSILVYKDTGNIKTSRLIVLVNTLAAGSLPIVPNGADIIIKWDKAGIFSIS
jgi:hypothetical protein